MTHTSIQIMISAQVVAFTPIYEATSVTDNHVNKKPMPMNYKNTLDNLDHL